MKNMMKVVVCTLMVFLLVACGSTSTSEKTFVFASEFDINSLDSAKADDGMSLTAIHAISEGLMGMDKDGKRNHAIADKHEVTPDKRTYTFTLKNAKWSNGDPVKAEDFVFSWRRILKESGIYAYMLGTDGAGIKNADAIMKKQQSGSLRDADLQTLGVQAKDDKTLVVQLENPIPYFLDLMTFPCFYPQNEKFVTEKGKDFATSPETMISNGAFVLSSWTKGSNIEYKKNKDYYNADAVKLDVLQMTLAQDAKTSAMNFDSGANDYCSINSELVDKYKKEKTFKQYNEGYVFYLLLNFKNPVLANINVRKALSFAIDRQDFVDNVLKDGSQIATGFVPTQLSKGPDGKDFRESSGTYTEFDLAKAQTYVEQALKELGKESVSLRLLYGTDESPMDQMAEYLQNAFSKLKGLKIEMVATTKNDRIHNKEAKGEFDIALTRWGPEFADPTAFLNLLLSGNDYNYGKYTNKEVDAKMEEAKASINDPAKRWAALLTTEKLGMQDYAYVPVFEKGRAVLQKENVSGVIYKSVGVPYTFYYVDIK